VVDLLQTLIDKGYYIVFLNENNDEMLPELKYDKNKFVEKYGLKVIRK